MLSSVNDYERPFAVLLSLEEVEARTRSKRIQFQVNFRSDIQLSGRAKDSDRLSTSTLILVSLGWASTADLPELLQLPIGIDELALVSGQIGELAIDALADAFGGQTGLGSDCRVDDVTESRCEVNLVVDGLGNLGSESAIAESKDCGHLRLVCKASQFTVVRFTVRDRYIVWSLVPGLMFGSLGIDLNQAIALYLSSSTPVAASCPSGPQQTPTQSSAARGISRTCAGTSWTVSTDAPMVLADDLDLRLLAAGEEPSPSVGFALRSKLRRIDLWRKPKSSPFSDQDHPQPPHARLFSRGHEHLARIANL